MDVPLIASQVWLLAVSTWIATATLVVVAQRQCRVTVHWRGTAFFAMLFWFWYLAPAALESRAVEQVLQLLQP